MTGDDAWALLCEHTRSDSLRKHGLAVEAAMRQLGRRNGENEESWAIAGLLHDFDYERDPQGHPQNGKPILEQAGVPGNIVHAIQSHGDHTGIPRVTPMEKTLYAVDELCGFVTAVALVRPSKRVAEVEPSSVRKKMNDKAFARPARRSRPTVRPGLERLAPASWPSSAAGPAARPRARRARGTAGRRSAGRAAALRRPRRAPPDRSGGRRRPGAAPGSDAATSSRRAPRRSRGRRNSSKARLEASLASRSR